MRSSKPKWLGVLLVVASVLLCVRADGWHVSVMAPSAVLAFAGLSLLLHAEEMATAGAMTRESARRTAKRPAPRRRIRLQKT